MMCYSPVRTKYQALKYFWKGRSFFMTIISQIIVVLLIGLTAMIIMYANRGLKNAAEEGEHFVDEWAIRQVKKEEKKLEKTQRKELSCLAEHGTPYEKEESPRFAEQEMTRKVTPVFELLQFDENHKIVESYPVDHLPFYLGRDPENDLVLNDLYIARRHCRIVDKGGRIVVEDLGTANKIFADGEVVNEYILSDGCRFYLGSSEFQMKRNDHRSQATILAYKPERMSS